MMFQTFYFVECFHFCIEGRDPMEFWVVSMHECIDREKTYRNKSSFREKSLYRERYVVRSVYSSLYRVCVQCWTGMFLMVV